MSEIKLISSFPGSVTSMDYSLELGNVVRYNFELKRLQPIQQIASSLPLEGASNGDNNVVLAEKVGRTSYYDNILEKLERKYSSAHFEPDDSEEDFDGDIRENQKSKKRTRVANDVYEDDDGFIDDSEAVVEMDRTLKMKSVKTKHNGYFVSSGVLEIVEDYGESENEGGKGDADDVVVTSVEKPLSSTSPVTALTTPPKPAWQPCTEVSEALSTFEQFYREACPKVKKGVFPRELDGPLLVLDGVVHQHCDPSKVNTDNKTDTDKYMCKNIVLLKLPEYYDTLKSMAMQQQTIMMEVVESLSQQMGSKISKNPVSSSVPVVDPDHPSASGEPPAGPTEGSGDNISTDVISAKVDTPVSYCPYICNWTSDMRALLYQLELCIVAWIAKENAFRECLTTADYKTMSTEEEREAKASLKEKVEITRVLNQLSTNACVSCMLPHTITIDNCTQFSLTYLRRVIAAEKTKVRRRVQKAAEKESEKSVTGNAPEFPGPSKVYTETPALQSSIMMSTQSNDLSAIPLVVSAAAPIKPPTSAVSVVKATTPKVTGAATEPTVAKSTLTKTTVAKTATPKSTAVKTTVPVPEATTAKVTYNLPATEPTVGKAYVTKTTTAKATTTGLTTAKVTYNLPATKSTVIKPAVPKANVADVTGLTVTKPAAVSAASVVKVVSTPKVVLAPTGAKNTTSGVSTLLGTAAALATIPTHTPSATAVRERWTTEEEDALTAGIAKHGTQWAAILKDGDFASILHNRSNTQLMQKNRSRVAKQNRLTTNTVVSSIVAPVSAPEVNVAQLLQPPQEPTELAGAGGASKPGGQES